MVSEKKTKTRLADAVSEIGKHYNVLSKSAFFNILIDIDNKQILEANAVSNVIESIYTEPKHRLGELFLQSTEGALGIVELLQLMDEIITEDLKKTAGQTMRILFEPEAMKSHPGASAIALRIPRAVDGLYTGAYGKKKIAKLGAESLPRDVAGDEIQKNPSLTASIRDLMWNDKISEAMGGRNKSDWLTINENLSAPPTKENPHISCFLINDPELSPASKDANVVALFMAFAPTLELSRAQPYLNIKVISKRAPLDKNDTINTMSLSQFLLGNVDLKSYNQDNPTKITASAVDANLLTISANPKNDQDPSLPPPLSSAGMELFTAPQMLVPANEIWDSPDFDYSIRSAPLIDRFRPLATINSINFTVTPAGGLMAYKTGELSIILHDRSRMGEIGEFIKPNMYGNTEIMITWGWSHPDALLDIESSSNTQSKLSTNPFATILNAMRVTEKYKIVNSSFSFDGSGQVEIKLSLTAMSSISFDTNNISQGPHVADKLKSMQEFIDQINEIKRETTPKGEGQSTSDVSGETWLGSVSSPESINNMSEDLIKQMKEWRIQNAKASGTTGKLADALNNLLGPDPNKLGGAAGALKLTIEEALAGKKELIESPESGDPFWRPIWKDKKNYCKVRRNLCDPLESAKAASKHNQEVQDAIDLLEERLTNLNQLNREGGFDTESPPKIVDLDYAKGVGGRRAPPPPEEPGWFDSAVSVLSDVGDAIVGTAKEIVGADNDPAQEAADKANEELAPAAARHRQVTEDPEFQAAQVKSQEPLKEDPNRFLLSYKKFVSLGKLFMAYAVTPLAVEARYDEIQIFFYCFNEYASFMHDRNISEFPIPYEEFTKELAKRTQRSAYMSITTFLEFLNSTFISKIHTPAYGLSDLYTTDKEGKVDVAEKFKNNQTALHDAKNERFHYAYDPARAAAKLPPLNKIEFRHPRLALFTETVPAMNPSDLAAAERGSDSFTILKIHIYDKTATPYSTLQELLRACRDEGLRHINLSPKGSKGAGSGENKTGSITSTDEYRMKLAMKLLERGVIEEAPAPATGDPSRANQRIFKVKGGLPEIRKFIKQSMPSITFGAQNTAIISASVSSMNSPELVSINMVKENDPASNSPAGVRSAGLPLRVAPVELSMEIFGCPLINFGQQFFIDFGTGTTVDNVYMVNGVEHSLAQGEFKTKLKFVVGSDAYGVYESHLDVVNKAMAIVSDAKDSKKKG